MVSLRDFFFCPQPFYLIETLAQQETGWERRGIGKMIRAGIKYVVGALPGEPPKTNPLLKTIWQTAFCVTLARYLERTKHINKNLPHNLKIWYLWR